MRVLFPLALLFFAGCASPLPAEGPVGAASSGEPGATADEDEADATPETPADASADLAAGPTHATGTSSVSVLVACVPDVEGGVCILTARDWGSFEVEASTGDGQLALKWESPPTLKGLRVYLMIGEEVVAQTTADGPLAIPVPRLAVGTYEVRVFPDTSVGPTDVEVAWTYDAV